MQYSVLVISRVNCPWLRRYKNVIIFSVESARKFRYEVGGEIIIKTYWLNTFVYTQTIDHNQCPSPLVNIHKRLHTSPLFDEAATSSSASNLKKRKFRLVPNDTVAADASKSADIVPSLPEDRKELLQLVRNVSPEKKQQINWIIFFFSWSHRCHRRIIRDLSVCWRATRKTRMWMRWSGDSVRFSWSQVFIICFAECDDSSRNAKRALTIWLLNVFYSILSVHFYN